LSAGEPVTTWPFDGFTQVIAQFIVPAVFEHMHT
jgi:hypothetical protein